jgi:hypothetical protein
VLDFAVKQSKDQNVSKAQWENPMNSETHATDHGNADSTRTFVATSEDLSLALRIACWGGILAAAIAYAVLISLKSSGLLEPEMTWMRVILGPALMFSLLPAPIVTVIWFPKRETLALCILSVVYVVVCLGLILLDSGISR